MKRITIVLLSVLLVASLFVSCKVEVDDPMADLVSIRFTDDDGSKGLNVSVPGLDEYTWYYKANKNSADGTGLKTGATGEDFVIIGGETGSGKLSEKAGPFSQGLWDFELQARNGESIVYTGKVSAVSVNKETTTVKVVVEPSQTGENGYLVIPKNIPLYDAQNHAASNYVMEVEIKTLAEVSVGATNVAPDDADYELFSLAPASYRVSLTYKSGDGTYTYGSSETVVTIYSNMTTTLGGSVDENTSSITFGPDGTIVAAPTVIEKNETTGVKEVTVKGSPVDETKTTTVNFGDASSSIDDGAKLSATMYPRQAAAKGFSVADGNGVVLAGIDLKIVGAVDSNFGANAVTVSTYIGEGYEKDDLKVFYTDGTEHEVVSYDADTGVLTFKTTHFSSFYVVNTAVVAINETQNVFYKTLQEAVNAAKDGDVIILQKDASGGVYFGYNNDNTDWAKDEVKSFIVDFNGTTYDANPTVGSTNTKTNGFQMLKGNTVTLRNGTLKSGAAKILIQNYCNLTLENMNLISSAKYALSNNCGKVSITGDTNIENTGGRFAFDACWATVSDGLYSDGTQVVVDTTGTITGTVRFDLWGTYGSPCNTSLVIENGKFVKFKILVDDVLKEDAKKNIKIVGGTFDSDPSEYVAEGYFAAPQDGSYIVRALEDDDVATIDGIYVYKSLQAAVEATESDQTIFLVNDVVLQERIKIGKTVSVDLNGYKLSADYSSKKCDSLFIIEDNGCLSIDDRSDSKTGIAYAPTPEKQPNGRNVSTFCFTLFPSEENSRAKLFVNGGNYEAYSNGAIVSGNGDINKYKGTTEIVIKDGYLKADTVVYHPQKGTLKVTGGHFEGCDSAIEMRAGSLIITGGEFSSSAFPASVTPNGNGSTTSGSAIAVAQHTTRLPIEVNISGGKFSGYHAMSVMNPEGKMNNDESHPDFQNVEVKVTGGVFSANGTTANGSPVDVVVNTDDCFAISENPSYGSDSEKANFTVSAVITPNT